MIDFIRINFSDKVGLEKYIIDSKDVFTEIVSAHEERTGEERYPKTTKFYNLQVKVHEKSAVIVNSLHYLKNELKNNGSHNYDDFTYSELESVIDTLNVKIPLISTGTITQLEFGFNLKLNKNVKRFLLNDVKMHRYKQYNVARQYPGGAQYTQYEYDQYNIKIYDKGVQFNLDYELLRFEIKIRNKKILHKLGVYSIDDLKDKNVLGKLFNYLLVKFDQMVIVDNFIDREDISQEDNIELELLTNPKYWIRFDNRKLRNKKSKKSKDLIKLIETYELDRTKKDIRNKLIQKFNQLINN